MLVIIRPYATAVWPVQKGGVLDERRGCRKLDGPRSEWKVTYWPQSHYWNPPRVNFEDYLGICHFSAWSTTSISTERLADCSSRPSCSLTAFWTSLPLHSRSKLKKQLWVS